MKKILASISAFLGCMVFAVAAFSQEAEAVVTTVARGDNSLAICGVMIGMALATFGGALGQGKAAAAALEGIARNPGAASKVQTPMILGLALIESLVLFSLLIAFILQGKIS